MTAPRLRAAEPPVRLILGIETSTPHGGVSLADADGRLIAHRWSHASNGYSRRLLAAVDALLAEAGQGREALAGIAVTLGPGSFTGVRIGLATAKTVAHSFGIPLFGFSTLEMVARRWPAAARIGVLLDARRGEIYSALYDRASGGELTVLRGEHVEPCAAFLDAMPGEGQILFTGDGVPAYRDEIVARLGARAEFAAPPWNLPAADAVALAGAAALAAGENGLNPLEAAPEYLRASDAERNLPVPQ